MTMTEFEKSLYCLSTFIAFYLFLGAVYANIYVRKEAEYDRKVGCLEFWSLVFMWWLDLILSSKDPSL